MPSLWRGRDMAWKRVVVIEVTGGVADVVVCPEDVQVIIRDNDIKREG